MALPPTVSTLFFSLVVHHQAAVVIGGLKIGYSAGIGKVSDFYTGMGATATLDRTEVGATGSASTKKCFLWTGATTEVPVVSTMPCHTAQLSYACSRVVHLALTLGVGGVLHKPSRH